MPPKPKGIELGEKNMSQTELRFANRRAASAFIEKTPLDGKGGIVQRQKNFSDDIAVFVFGPDVKIGIAQFVKQRMRFGNNFDHTVAVGCYLIFIEDR